MSWEKEISGIRARRAAAQNMGGAEALAKQRGRGRLNIRERVAAIADPGTFEEQGPIAGHSESDAEGNLREFIPANYVLGVARIGGRPCVIGGEDFTQRGGSPSPAGLRKSVYAESLAVQYRLPLVRLLEGGGGSVTGAAGKDGGGRAAARPAGDSVNAPPRFQSIMQAMAVAPVASAALGAVAGFPAARLVASHFSVMTKSGAQVIIGGPALVERATGERLSKQELGGAQVHARSGVVDNVAEDENDALQQIRRFLSYLPANVWELPPRIPESETAAPSAKQRELLRAIIPRERRRIYDARALINAVVDANSFFEMARNFGRSQITGLARLGGRAVGVWANCPRYYAGAMTANAAQKVRRFADLCDTFHLPVIAFVDEPGFMIGAASEAAATIRHGAAAIFAVQQARVPFASVIVRKAYGVAAAAHFGPHGHVLAWPSAEGGALPIEGGVAVAFRREIAAAENPEAKRAEYEAKFAAARSPYARAEAFGVHDLIDPAETRPALLRWLRLCAPLLQTQLGPRRYSIRP